MNLEHPDITKMRMYGTLLPLKVPKIDKNPKAHTFREITLYPLLTENEKNAIINQKTKKD